MFDDSGSWESESRIYQAIALYLLKPKKVIGFRKKEIKHEEERETRSFGYQGRYSIRRYDKQKKCFQRENGSYSNLYQIIPRDLVNSDVDEIEMDCYKWAKFLKIYGLDMKSYP